MNRRRSHSGNWGESTPGFLRTAITPPPSAAASQALTRLSFDQLCMVVEIHIGARKDVNIEQLERLSNTLGLQAHMGARL